MKTQFTPRILALGFVVASFLTATLLSGGCSSNNGAAKSSSEEMKDFAGDPNKIPPEVRKQAEANRQQK